LAGRQVCVAGPTLIKRRTPHRTAPANYLDTESASPQCTQVSKESKEKAPMPPRDPKPCFNSFNSSLQSKQLRLRNNFSGSGTKRKLKPEHLSPVSSQWFGGVVTGISLRLDRETTGRMATNDSSSSGPTHLTTYSMPTS